MSEETIAYLYSEYKQALTIEHFALEHGLTMKQALEVINKGKTYKTN